MLAAIGIQTAKPSSVLNLARTSIPDFAAEVNSNFEGNSDNEVSRSRLTVRGYITAGFTCQLKMFKNIDFAWKTRVLHLWKSFFVEL